MLIPALLALSSAFAEDLSTPFPVITDCIANMDADEWNERAIAVSTPSGVWIAVIDNQGIIPLTPSLLKIPTEGRSLVCSQDVVAWVNAKGQPELSWTIAASLTYALPLYQTCFADVDKDRITETVMMLASQGRSDVTVMVLDTSSVTTLAQTTLTLPLAELGIGCGPGLVSFGQNNSDSVASWAWNGKGYALLPSPDND